MDYVIATGRFENPLTLSSIMLPYNFITTKKVIPDNIDCFDL